MNARSILDRIRSLCTDRSGNVALVFGLSLIPIVGLAGMAIDYSRASSAQSAAQSALDSAVLAASGRATASRAGVAADLFAANFTASGGISASTPSFATNSDGSFTGTVTVTVPPTVGAVAGLPSQVFPVTATALARSATTSRVCILVLDPSSSQTFLVNSGVNLSAPKCEIDVASTNTTAGMINSSLPDVAAVCIAGGDTVNGGATVNNLASHCRVATDTIANTIPAPTVGSCTVSNQNYAGTQNLSPGTYCGTFNFNGSGTLNLAAGLYILKGAHWNLNSGWSISGAGVTFYFADSASYVQFNADVQVNLAAPASGTYANVLMFEPGNLSPSSFAIDGSASGHALQGLIYLPSRNVTFNGTSNVVSDALTLVVNQIILDTLNWSISPASNGLAAAGGTAAGTPVLVH